jgi:hypothetical protein
MAIHLAPVFEGSRFTRVAFAETLATFYFGPARVDDSLGRYIDRAGGASQAVVRQPAAARSLE